jgi:hypothetical protein
MKHNQNFYDVIAALHGNVVYLKSCVQYFLCQKEILRFGKLCEGLITYSLNRGIAFLCERISKALTEEA